MNPFKYGLVSYNGSDSEVFNKTQLYNSYWKPPNSLLEKNEVEQLRNFLKHDIDLLRHFNLTFYFTLTDADVISALISFPKGVLSIHCENEEARKSVQKVRKQIEQIKKDTKVLKKCMDVLKTSNAPEAGVEYTLHELLPINGEQIYTVSLTSDLKDLLSFCHKKVRNNDPFDKYPGCIKERVHDLFPICASLYKEIVSVSSV
jgi:hypothetical protein